MKTASLFFPVNANNGESLAVLHTATENHLVARYGGFTAYTASGGYRFEDGSTIVEDVIRYDVGMSTDDGVDFAELRSFARALAALGNQECVMIVSPYGEVEFVSQSHDIAAAGDSLDCA